MEMDAENIRIVTLNIWHRLGPWRDRLRLIRREIQRLQPALVGLQEVKRDAAGSQADEIAQGLGYEVAYAPASDLGNALLSRYPLTGVRTLRLPALDTGERRSMLCAFADTPLGRLPVFVTHLSWRLDHGRVRLAQVRAVQEQIDELAPFGGELLPPVLMGDLNSDAESDEMRFLRGLSVVDGRSTYYADAWLYAGDGTAGYTYDRRNDFARTVREPSRRIDYILVRRPDPVLRGEPVHASLAFTTPEVYMGERVWPSDHFGLCSDIRYSG